MIQRLHVVARNTDERLPELVTKLPSELREAADEAQKRGLDHESFLMRLAATVIEQKILGK